jgi:hypothetical protein
VLARRSSSQSSTGASDIGSKEGDSSLGSRYGGSQSSFPAIPEKPEQHSASTDKGKWSTSLSAKAAGKRPASQSHIENPLFSKPEDAQSSQSQDQTPIARKDNTEIEQQSPTAQPERREEVARSTGNRPRTHRSPAVQGGETEEQRRREFAPTITRSSSDIGSMRSTSREPSRPYMPSSSLRTSIPAQLDTSVIGQGTISVFQESFPNQDPSIGRLNQPSDSAEAGKIPSAQGSVASGFPKQFTPTQPSNTSTIPLGRSKSQLELLLDRKGDRRPKR